MTLPLKPLVASDVLKWHLRKQMASREIYTGRELQKRLAEVGYRISEAQISRLKRALPKHLDMTLLAALCVVLELEPADLLLRVGSNPQRNVNAARPDLSEQPAEATAQTETKVPRKSILQGQVYPSTGPKIGAMPRGKI